jgi:hypothetical protein
MTDVPMSDYSIVHAKIDEIVAEIQKHDPTILYKNNQDNVGVLWLGGELKVWIRLEYRFYRTYKRWLLQVNGKDVARTTGKKPQPDVQAWAGLAMLALDKARADHLKLQEREAATDAHRSIMNSCEKALKRAGMVRFVASDKPVLYVVFKTTEDMKAAVERMAGMDRFPPMPDKVEDGPHGTVMPWVHP